jgi:hypothetical protein
MNLWNLTLVLMCFPGVDVGEGVFVSLSFHFLDLAVSGLVMAGVVVVG